MALVGYPIDPGPRSPATTLWGVRLPEGRTMQHEGVKPAIEWTVDDDRADG